ncbi:MAG TPA: hypothetical protein EYH26_02810 [Pyrodictium sp.]|nr:hypothetical protein [Pyrodictium sp.]HIQ10890.1 hypothetical protein [Pyrodictium sp.]HIQ55592.1 hypothetical protein [Pyrodictium sp.]
MDYWDPRLLSAVDKAVEILLEHMGEWEDEVDAYWLLRKHENRIGVPVTYDIVEEAVAKIRSKIAKKHAIGIIEV